MADLTTPDLSTDPQGALSKAQSDYERSQQELLQKLVNRESNKEIPWFALAGALLKPTRTGSFFESAGNAGDVMGQWQEEQKKQELPNAQMRAQITKSILDTTYDKTAMNALSKITGMQPNDLVSATNNGQFPALSSGQFTQLQSAYPLLSRSPTFGPVVKSMIDFQNQNEKNRIDQGRLTSEINAHDRESLALLVNFNLDDPTNLPSSVKAIIETLSPQARAMIMPKAPEKAGEPPLSGAVTAPVTPQANVVPEPIPQYNAYPIPTGMPNANPPSAAKPTTSAPTSPLPAPALISQLVLGQRYITPNNNPVTDLQASPMVQQNVFAPSTLGAKPTAEATAKLLEEQQKADIDASTKKAQYFLDQTKDVTNQKYLQAQRLEQLSANPRIWGLLNSKEGDSLLAKSAKIIGQLADEGVGLNLNQFSARIGLPVTSIYKNAVLNDSDKQQLAEALRILSAMRVQTAKEKPFGAAPSNFEDKIQLGAMPSESDLPLTIASYAREQQMNAKYLQQHNAGIYADKDAYEKQFKTPYPFRYYFDPNRKGSPYNSVEDRYLRDKQSLYRFLDKEYGVK
jgi:hypothetical protein